MRTPNVCLKSRWRQPGPLWWRAGGALNKALRQVGNGPGAGCRAASALHAAWAGHDTRPLRGPMVQLQSLCPPCGACVNGQRGGTRRVCALAHRYAAQGRAWRRAHGCCRHAGGPGRAHHSSFCFLCMYFILAHCTSKRTCSESILTFVRLSVLSSSSVAVRLARFFSTESFSCL